MRLIQSSLALREELAGVREELERTKAAANLLVDYCEAHEWGLMPEPFDSINPLLKLLGRELWNRSNTR